MEWIIGWVAFSVLAGIIASNKGRSFFEFFLLSLVLSPLLGIIAALIARSNTKKLEWEQIVSGDSKRCPYCAELIKAEAIKCRFCGTDLALGEGTQIRSNNAICSKQNRQRVVFSHKTYTPEEQARLIKQNRVALAVVTILLAGFLAWAFYYSHAN